MASLFFVEAADELAGAGDELAGVADELAGVADEPAGVAGEPAGVTSLAQPATIIPSKTRTPNVLTDWTPMMKPLQFERNTFIGVAAAILLPMHAKDKAEIGRAGGQFT
jgi:hypothetical protein